MRVIELDTIVICSGSIKLHGIVVFNESVFHAAKKKKTCIVEND